MAVRYDEDSIPTVHSTDEIPATELRSGFSIQCFRSLHNLIGFVHAEPGAETNFHEHPWEQVVHVVGGEADFYLDGEEVALSAGDVLFVPPSVEHELRPRDDQSVDLIAIWPLNESFLDLTGYQEEFQTDG